MSKYGSFAYGDEQYGASLKPFNYQIRLLDASGNTVEILDKVAVDGFTWSFLRYGGCGSASLKIRRAYEHFADIGADYRVEAYINSTESTRLSKVYQGYVVDKTPAFGAPDVTEIRLQGMWAQAQRVIVGRTVPYERTASTIASIVSDIINTYVAPVTDILYDGNLIDSVFDDDGSSYYRPDYIQFSQPAMACIEYLAKIAGDYVYGVDRDGYFYFRRPGTTNDFNYWYGSNVVSYQPTESFENIINRCIVKTRWYSLALERDDDRAVSEQQTTDTGSAPVGKSTVFQKLKQTFTTDKKSISKIRLKAAPINANGNVSPYFGKQYSGYGFDEMINDGAFSRGDYAFWKTYGAGTDIEIQTDSSGNKYMEVLAPVAGGGMYQDVYGCGAGQWTLRLNYALQRGDMKIIIAGSSSGTETELVSSDRITSATKGKSFQSESVTFTIDTAYDYIRVYFVSDYIFASKFFIDNVSLVVVAGSLKFMLINNTTGEELLEEPIIKAITELPQSGEPAEFDVEINYYGCSAGTTYALVIERDGNLSDDNYFELRYNTAGGYGDGSLSFYNGVSWVDTVSLDLWFKVYYNQSQETYRLHEELITSPPTTDIVLLKKYINGYLATADRPTKRSVLQLGGAREVLDSRVPQKPLGMLSFRIGETDSDDVEALNIQSIQYTITDHGMDVDINAGEKLPDIARLFDRTKHDIQNQITTWGNN